MVDSFHRLIKNHTRLPLVLKRSDIWNAKRNLRLDPPNESDCKPTTFIFISLDLIRKVECEKCDARTDGARFSVKISGGPRRGPSFVDLCSECCIQHGWTTPELDKVLETQLMAKLGNRSW